MGWRGIKNQCRPLHNKDDVDYATGCMKKRRYETDEEAQKACASMELKTKKIFNYYDCRFCDKKHVGKLNTHN